MLLGISPELICFSSTFQAELVKICASPRSAGVNVTVMKNTSLKAAVSGRVKLTHDVTRDVMIMNAARFGEFQKLF